MEEPTRPTRPIGQPQTSVAREREVISTPPPDDLVLEELRRVRFWSYFGSAVAVLASVLAVIALLVAMSNDDQGGRSASSAQLQGVRQDLSGLRSDVSEARNASEQAADEVSSLARRVRRLEQAAADGTNVAEDLAQLEQDLNDLSDRVDQIELAQEEAASGGP